MVSPAELPGPPVRGVGENFESKSVQAAKFSRKNRHRIYRIIDSAREACTRRDSNTQPSHAHDA